MFAHLTRPHTIHQMELIPVLSGNTDWDREVEGNRLVASYVDMINTDVVQPHVEFFSQYYRGIG